MKAFSYILVILLLTSCSVVKVSDSWVNKEYINYQPKKILIVGLTDNLTARKIFEERLNQS